MYNAGKDGSKVTTVVATPGAGPDRPQEVAYTDTKVIGNGSFGVVYQAKLCDSGEMVAIKKVLQDKRFKVRTRPRFSTVAQIDFSFRARAEGDIIIFEIFAIAFSISPI